MKYILIVGGFSEVHRALKNQGNKLLLVNETKNIKPYFNTLYEEVLAFSDMKDIDRICQVVTSAFGKYKVSNIICMFDELQNLACCLANKLNAYYHLSENQVQMFNNKLDLRRLLREAAIDNVLSDKVESIDEIRNFMLYSKKDSFIVKPIYGSGSRAIYKIEKNKIKEKELLKYIKSNNEPLTIEEFIEGIEYSVEAISIGGIHYIYGITKKFKDEHFVEAGHIVPANIDELTTKHINEFVIDLLNVLQYQNGPSHTEIMVDKNEVIHLIESHARLGGDMISKLYQLAFNNFDPIQLASYSLTNTIDDISINLSIKRYAAVQFIPFEGNKIQSVDVKERNNDVADINIYVKKGDKKREYGSGNRIGHIIVTSNDYNILETKLDSGKLLNDCVQVCYE